jgi:ATP-dependent RNA helicase DeaD
MTPETMTPQDINMSTLECTPTTDDIKVTASGFTKLNLSENILKAIAEMNFTDPSAIQAASIPQIMTGVDTIAKAPTGSGKTAAFAIPILEKLDLNRDNRNVQALVLCPTRELAIQVHKEFEKLSKYMENVSVVSVYGGQPIDRQLTALRKSPQVVVATPGRLMDHLRRGSVNLSAINMIVLDEADEMLDMGFRDDINTILEDTSEERQTVLFSATMAKDIIAITKKFQKNPIIVDVMDSVIDTPDIEQLYFEVSEKGKIELLTRLLDLHNVKLALVFCNTKSNVDRVVEILKTRGYFSDSLHGDMNQSQREKVMRGFRNGGIEILVATDVAGRGIDVKDIEAVFNYDLPRDDEDYIHRVGRTGRAGKSGTAFTFITKNQVQNIRRIERANGVLINKREVPTYEELESARINTYQEKIQNIINCDDLTEHISKVEALVSDEMPLMKIAAALLKMSMNKESKKINKNITFEDSIDESSERDRHRRGSRGGRNRNNSGGSRDGISFDRGPRQGNNRNFGDRNNNRSYGGDSNRKSGSRDFVINNDKNGDRQPKQKDEFTLDNLIQSAKSNSEPRRSNFIKPKNNDNFGSTKQNKDYKSRNKKSKTFSPR